MVKVTIFILRVLIHHHFKKVCHTSVFSIWTIIRMVLRETTMVTMSLACILVHVSGITMKWPVSVPSRVSWRVAVHLKLISIATYGHDFHGIVDANCVNSCFSISNLGSPLFRFFVVGLAFDRSTYIPCTRKSFFCVVFCLFFECSQLSDLVLLYTALFSVLSFPRWRFLRGDVFRAFLSSSSFYHTNHCNNLATVCYTDVFHF